MTKTLFVFTLLLGQNYVAISQDTTVVFFDSYSKVTANSYGIVKLVNPQNDTIYNSGIPYQIKYPKHLKFLDTAFTTVYFTGNDKSILDREIALLVGNYKSKKPTYYIDRNGNLDFSDDGSPLAFKEDSTLDFFMTNSNYVLAKFGVRHFYPKLKKSDEAFLSSMGPLARKNEFVPIEYWLGEQRLNNRMSSITIEGLVLDIGLHDYNCNGTFNDVGKDKVIFRNQYDSSISTQRQHGAIVISDTTTVLINDIVYHIDNISIDGSSFRLSKCHDSCEIVHLIQVGKKLTHAKYIDMDSTIHYIDEIQDPNKYLLIDVWGLWCKGCQQQLPRLEELYKANKSNLQVLSLNWGDNRGRVDKHLTEKPLLWPNQGFAAKEFIEQYMVDGFPNYILVGKDGAIIKLGTNLTEVKKIIEQ